MILLSSQKGHKHQHTNHFVGEITMDDNVKDGAVHLIYAEKAKQTELILRQTAVDLARFELDYGDSPESRDAAYNKALKLLEKEMRTASRTHPYKNTTRNRAE